MDAKLSMKKSLERAPALRQDHDELRAELSRASMEPGPIGEAAKRVARLCLPHFAQEEKTVFPAFGLLQDLVAGHVQPEMAGVLPLVTRFIAWHDDLNEQHLSIISAVDALLEAAIQDGSREFANLAYKMKGHERIEDEVIYPTVTLIGKYVQERLGI